MANNKKNLQDRIKDIKEFFKGIEIRENLFIVKIVYPNKWNAYDRNDGMIKAAKSDVIDNEWFYYANIDEVELNDIFDLVQETVKTNEDIYKKVELMKEKMEELKNLFQNESLEKLQTLIFTFQEKKSKRTNKRKQKAIELVNEVNSILTEENNDNVEEKIEK